MTIPTHPDWKKREPFPSIKRDMVFDIALTKIVSAGVVSPDYPDERPVSLQLRENGATRVTVKAADLKGYSTVYLQCK